MVLNTLPNNCWFWSSIHIMKAYVENIGIPKELSNKMVKKILKNEPVAVTEYDKQTKKQADIDKNLNGNAVEFLALNGFHYTNCFDVRDACAPFVNVEVRDILPFAFLLQYQQHVVSVILEGDEYILYDHTGEYLNKYAVAFDKERKIIRLPIEMKYTNIYVFDIFNQTPQ